MLVFISWSGERSKKLADALRNFLRNVLPEIHLWFSDEDIGPGAIWGDQLRRALQQANVGVLCITPENGTQPWLLFEAGAISKSVSESKCVVPYCLGSPSDSAEPISSQFQGVRADLQGTRRLVRTLASQAAILNGRAQAQVSISEEDLTRSFEAAWPELGSAINELKALDTTDFALWKEIERERQNVEELYERVKGAWWERIEGEGVGFFRIRKDTFHNSLCITDAFFYDTNGVWVAEWSSAIARVVQDERHRDQKLVIYLRECWPPDSTSKVFHGFGFMRFQGSGASFSQGSGDFYDVYQQGLQRGEEQAARKVVRLRRANEIEVEIMGYPSEEEKQALASEVYKNWSATRIGSTATAATGGD